MSFRNVGCQSLFDLVRPPKEPIEIRKDSAVRVSLSLFTCQRAASERCTLPKATKPPGPTNGREGEPEAPRKRLAAAPCVRRAVDGWVLEPPLPGCQHAFSNFCIRPVIFSSCPLRSPFDPGPVARPLPPPRRACPMSLNDAPPAPARASYEHRSDARTCLDGDGLRAATPGLDEGHDCDVGLSVLPLRASTGMVGPLRSPESRRGGPIRMQTSGVSASPVQSRAACPASRRARGASARRALFPCAASGPRLRSATSRRSTSIRRPSPGHRHALSFRWLGASVLTAVRRLPAHRLRDLRLQRGDTDVVEAPETEGPSQPRRGEAGIGPARRATSSCAPRRSRPPSRPSARR